MKNLDLLGPSHFGPVFALYDLSDYINFYQKMGEGHDTSTIGE